MTSARVELFVIGDEILSGKRQDRHFRQVVAILQARGMALSDAQFIGDDIAQIADAIRRVRQAGGVLLSCGGIGATPDDCTRQAAALAFDRPIEVHAQALALIEARYGKQAHPNRALMAQFPRGADLIPHPVNQVAGFSVGHCYFVPGFPEMAWPMLEWVLDQRLMDLHQAQPPVEYSLRVTGPHGEGDLLDLMQATLKAFPGIKLSSLPSRGADGGAPHIEFGLRGPQQQAAAAYVWFNQQMQQIEGVRVEALHAPD